MTGLARAGHSTNWRSTPARLITKGCHSTVAISCEMTWEEILIKAMRAALLVVLAPNSAFGRMPTSGGLR